ncbi:MAG TPA: hypothetical protein VN653_16155 [Anaerolineales bacterium]|nr:hypothetical protein [Anaerolineales bacterium]
MNLRTFLTVSAILAFGYSLGTFLVPVFMTTTYGFGTSGSEILLARLYGIELLVVGVTAWLSKDLPLASVRPFLTANVIGNAVGTVFALMGTLSGVMNSAGWSAVAIFLLLMLGSGYFRFMAPAK